MPLTAATGGGPVDLVCDNAGDVFGIADGDAASSGSSTIFEIAAGATTPIVLAKFRAASQGVPSNLVIDGAGNLYGNALISRASDRTARNTLFEIAAHTDTLRDLASFSGGDYPGPSSLLSDAAGDLFGLNYSGSIFEIASGTTRAITLADINPNAGYSQFGSLARDAAGNLYAVINGNSIYEFVPATHAITHLVDIPFASVLGAANFVCDAAGDLYIDVDQGELMELPAGGRHLAPITGVAGLETLTLDADGDIFAEVLGQQFDTNESSTGDGAIVKIDAQTHALTTLISFDGSNGGYPSAAMVASPSGILYGGAFDENDAPPQTLSGAPYGSVFSITDAGFVNAPPSISSQPSNVVGIERRTAIISLTEAGYPYPAVQWQESADGGQTFIDITSNASATTTRLRLPDLAINQSGTEYRAVLTSPLGTTTSSPATLTVVPPVSFTSAPHASPNIVNGTTATLSTVGHSALSAPLTYKWKAVVKPLGAPSPTFNFDGTTAAALVTATFYKDGYYDFRCTISDGQGHSISSDVSVHVGQTATSFRVTPHNKTIQFGQTIQYHAALYDQFGHTLRTQPAASYSIVHGPGSIDATTGLFTSSIPGAVLIEAREDGFSGVVGAQVIA